MAGYATRVRADIARWREAGLIDPATAEALTGDVAANERASLSFGSILAMILQEALLLTAVSGYVGLMAGIGMIELLRWSGFKADYFRDPEVDLTVACGAMLVLIIGGVIAGLIPARQAARVNPVEALRSE